MVNDDGPPSHRLSPYIHPFVNALQDAGHLVSVAIPASSRSWIGKAHLIEASLEATYVPPSAFRNDGTWDTTSPSTEGEEKGNEWVVISNGTPASCVQLGLFNLFPPDSPKGPIDLIISGPNHGRNASTIYNLSSGTVGGALEAATCGKRGIAISFGSKDPQPAETIGAAARLAVRVVEYLARNWDERVELYNLNIPMREDVKGRPVRYTKALPYYWAKGYLYSEIPADESSHGHEGLCNGSSAESKKLVNGTAVNDTTNGTVSSKPASGLKKRSFKWAAELSDMKKALQASEEGTDAHTVLNGCTRYGSLSLSFFFFFSLLYYSLLTKIVSLLFWRISGMSLG